MNSLFIQINRFPDKIRFTQHSFYTDITELLKTWFGGAGIGLPLFSLFSGLKEKMNPFFKLETIIPGAGGLTVSVNKQPAAVTTNLYYCHFYCSELLIP